MPASASPTALSLDPEKVFFADAAGAPPPPPPGAPTAALEDAEALELDDDHEAALTSPLKTLLLAAECVTISGCCAPTLLLDAECVTIRACGAPADEDEEDDEEEPPTRRFGKFCACAGLGSSANRS